MNYDILKHTIKHECNPGVNCSGGHENCLEIPSSVFIDMTIYLKSVLKNETFPPDWQYHFQTWSMLNNMNYFFEDLGFNSINNFPNEETKKIIKKDEDENFDFQTTIIKLTGENENDDN